MLVWIDEESVEKVELEDTYIDNANYEVQVGKDFGGVIRSLSLM
jgi:hypothetical protein